MAPPSKLEACSKPNNIDEAIIEYFTPSSFKILSIMPLKKYSSEKPTAKVKINIIQAALNYYEGKILQ